MGRNAGKELLAFLNYLNCLPYLVYSTNWLERRNKSSNCNTSFAGTALL
jgi:hypothetical protein